MDWVICGVISRVSYGFVSIYAIKEYILGINLIQYTVAYNVTEFLISNTVFCYTALCLKIISQKWVAFAFGSTYLHQTFTECV